jgi:hypothetical protein
MTVWQKWGSARVSAIERLCLETGYIPFTLAEGRNYESWCLEYATRPWVYRENLYIFHSYPCFSHEMKGKRMSTQNTSYLLYIANWNCVHCYSPLKPERAGVVGLVSRYGLEILHRIPVRARFSAPVQTGPGAHLASYRMGIRSFPRVEWPGRGVYHTLLSSAEVKKGVEIYTCFPSVPSWLIPGVNFNLTLTSENWKKETWIMWGALG